jgi:glycerate kinase
LLPPGLGGGNLSLIAQIDMGGFQFPVGQVAVKIASDVTNPLLGTNGASVVYGPQKGATPEIVEELDAALTHFADLMQRDLGVDVADRAGAGAAGGLGAGLMAFLGAEVQSGIETVLDAIDFASLARNADWVFTGEGRIDAQTAQGKVIAGVLGRCRRLGVRVIAFGGSVAADEIEDLEVQGLWAAFPIVSGPMTVAEAMRDGERLLEDAVARVTRLLIPTAVR